MKVKVPTRTILRWIHVIVAIPIFGYIYSPSTRFVFFPLMVLTGLWMWKGHVVWRLISKRPATQESAG